MRKLIGLILIVGGVLVAVTTPAGAPKWIAAAALIILGILACLTGTSHKTAPRPKRDADATGSGTDADIMPILSSAVLISGSDHSPHSSHHGGHHDTGHGGGDSGGGGHSGGGGDGGGGGGDGGGSN